MEIGLFIALLLLFKKYMAPIFIKDFSWDEGDDLINVRLKWPLKASINPDIFTFKNYVKISSSPFVFELFLSNEIDEKQSKCYKTNNEYQFELRKANPGKWGTLEREIDKYEKIKLRNEVATAKQLALSEETENKKKQKRELQQIAVQEQIGADSLNRKIIEDIKNREKEIATKSIEDFRKKSVPIVTKKISASKAKIIQDSTKPVATCRDFPIPLVRKEGKIEVHFSERHFPTPSRESLLEQEKEYLAKQLAARRATGFVSEDLRPEECNPVWLKNKGDEFHKNQNYLGAVSAYSHAIKIGSTMPALYSNRAASHMALGNLHKALEDCSTALDLLTPPVALNAEARARAYARRGAILCQLGAPEKSLPEFEAAINLRPHDVQLREDYEKAKLRVEENENSDS